MRIVHLTRDFPPNARGGLSSAVGEWVRACRSCGVDNRVLSFDDWRPAKGAPRRANTGLAETTAGLFRVRHAGDLTEAAQWLASTKASILHVHDPLLWEFAQAASLESASKKVFTCHVVHSYMNRLRGVAASTRSSRDESRAMSEADLVTVPSRAALDIVRRLYPDAHERITELGFGFTPDRRETWAYPKENGTRRILYVGRFDSLKGTEDWFSCIASIARRCPEIQFDIVGGLPGNPRGEKRWLKRWGITWGTILGERIRFHGWLPHQALQEQFGQASLLVAPSHFESWGLVPLEAYPFGIPMILANNPAYRENLEGAEQIFWFEPGNREQLLSQIWTVLGKTSSLHQQRKPVGLVKSHRSWRERGRETVALYRSLL